MEKNLSWFNFSKSFENKNPSIRKFVPKKFELWIRTSENDFEDTILIHRMRLRPKF